MFFSGKLSMDGGSHLPFSFWLMEMADKFPIEKIKRLKSLIQRKFFFSLLSSITLM